MFKQRPFSETSYQENSLEPKKLIVLAIEGAVTEHIYFDYLKNGANDFELKAVVKLELLKRNKEDIGKSAPTHLVKELEGFLDDAEKIQEIKGDNFDNEYDILGIVADIEKSSDRKINIKKARESCEDNSIRFYLTNPCFEFWLLLHFDISKYCQSKLFENAKVSTNKKYIDSALSDQLGGYNKKKGGYKPSDFVTKETINLALNQEKKFENHFDKIIDNLGSNIGDLITEILDIE